MNKIDWPLQFTRQYSAPMDEDQVFDTTSERMEYLGSARRYPGQIVGDVEANRAFMINKSADGYVPLAPVMVGMVQLFAGTELPSGWMYCDSSSLQIDDYRELFNTIGVTYGGDGVTNFNIPDLMWAGPSPQINYIICVVGMSPGN